METTRVEGILSGLYSSSVVFSIISSVCLAVPWQHWTRTLNDCRNMDCGCILYGVTTFSVFMGGDVKVCTFGVYALIPVTLIALCFATYHGYRSFFGRKYDPPRIISQRTYQGSSRGRINSEIVITPRKRAPFKQWLTTACLAVVVCCLCLTHAVVVTDGYYKTCESYKRRLVKIVNAGPRVADAIHNRLDCGAMLDYMDYLQPDAHNWIRTERMNTKISLHLMIVMTWFNLCAWIIILIINFVMGKRQANSTGDSLFCCFN